MLARGTRRIEAETARDTYYAKTFGVSRKRTVEVIYLENVNRIFVVTAYVVGEYD